MNIVSLPGDSHLTVDNAETHTHRSDIVNSIQNEEIFLDEKEYHLSHRCVCLKLKQIYTKQQKHTQDPCFIEWRSILLYICYTRFCFNYFHEHPNIRKRYVSEFVGDIVLYDQGTCQSNLIMGNDIHIYIYIPKHTPKRWIFHLELR